MKNKPHQAPATRTALRRAAEAKHKATTAPRPPPMVAGRQRLQHELEVHQIELGMQNEELIATQVRAAAALERYTDLYDFAPVGYFNLTVTSAIHLVNLTGARLVGVERSRLVGRPFSSLLTGTDRRIFSDFLSRVFLKETRQVCELTLAMANRRTPLIVQLEATPSPDGKECRAVMLDITERKLAEAQLNASLAQLEELRQALDEHAIVAITDARGEITFVNDKFCAISKYSRAELIGQDHRLINSGFHPKKFIRDLWLTITQGKVWHGEIKNRAKDGSLYCVATTIVPFLNERGKPRQYISIRADITERMQAEEAVLESDRKFRSLFECMNEGAALHEMIYAANGQAVNYRIVDVNPVFEKHTGITRTEARGRLATEVYQLDAAPYLEIYERVARTGEPHAFEIWHAPMQKHFSVSSYSPKPGWFATVFSDITERKQAEAALHELSLRLSRAEETERRRIARELHDATGQKLAALSMTVGMLQDAARAPDRRTKRMFADCLEMIQQCSQEIRTHSYLLHPPLLDELGLAAAIGNYAAGFERRSGVRITFEPPPDFPRLPDLVEITLFRVVQESLGNLHRHSGAKTAHVRLVGDAEQVTLEISDQGRGMSTKTLRAINADSNSTGVGIAGMRERLRLVGGRLEIRSGKRGATVRATIPSPEVL